MGGLVGGWFSVWGERLVWGWTVEGRAFLVRVILLSPNSLASRIHSRSLIAVVC